MGTPRFADRLVAGACSRWFNEGLTLERLARWAPIDFIEALPSLYRLTRPPDGARVASRRNPMPYANTDDLPPSVKDHLPQHAREIFRASFNSAYEEHGEAAAFRIAWAAVKKRYRKKGSQWVEKDGAADDE